MLLVRSVITLLCAIGFYASVFMLRKSIRDARGQLGEPSVVQTERAKLYFGLPNSLFGVLYYAGIALVSWLGRGAVWHALALAAGLWAASTSAFLAASLVRNRRECPYCWTAHAMNWGLLAALPWLFVLR
jgi:uncharacterized membrane protein